MVIEKDIDVDKSKSSMALEKLKKIESKTKMHSKRISKTTIVFCKNKEKIKEYEEAYNGIKAFQ